MDLFEFIRDILQVNLSGYEKLMLTALYMGVTPEQPTKDYVCLISKTCCQGLSICPYLIYPN